MPGNDDDIEGNLIWSSVIIERPLKRLLQTSIG